MQDLRAGGSARRRSAKKVGGGGNSRRSIAPSFRSTNPLQRLSKEVNVGADVVGIFPDEESIIRPRRRRSHGA